MPKPASADSLSQETKATFSHIKVRVTRLPALLTQMKASPDERLDPADLAKLEELTRAKLAELRTTIDLRATQGFDAAAAVIRGNQGRQLMDEIRVTIEKMKIAQLTLLQQESAASDATTRTRTAVFIFTGLLNILFLVVGLSPDFQHAAAARRCGHHRGGTRARD